MWPLLLLFPIAITSQSQQFAGKEKADTLRALSSMSDGLIQLNATGYEHYVVDYPRPYTLVVLFSADTEKFKCSPCDQLMGVMQNLIYSYRESGGEYPSTSPTGVKQRAVFFAMLEYSLENSEIYKRHGFVSVPNIIVTHPKSVVFDGYKYHVQREDTWEFHTGSDILAHKILDFVNNRSGRRIEMKMPLSQVISQVVFMMLLLGGLAYVMYNVRKQLLNRHLWFFACLLIYFIGISGVIYDIIHKMPLAGINPRSGQIEYIHPGVRFRQQRSQYAGEGLFVGFLSKFQVVCLCGICLVGLNTFSRMNSAQVLDRGQIRFFGIIGIFLTLYCMYKIIAMHQLKSPWYVPQMYPPGYYIKGPFHKDQGISFQGVIQESYLELLRRDGEILVL